MGIMWAFCEKCKATTPHKIDFDSDDEPYYRCEVCAGNITAEFARGYKCYREEQRKKAGVEHYKIGEG